MSVHSVTLPEAQGTIDIYMVFWVSDGMTKTEDRELVLRKDCPEIVEPHGEIFDGQTWEVSHQDPWHGKAGEQMGQIEGHWGNP